MALSRYFALVAAGVAALSVSATAAMPGAQGSSNHKQKYSYAYVAKSGDSIINNWSLSTQGDYLRKGGQDRIYVRKDGKTYVITDAATIAEMKRALEPMMKIGKLQGELGEKQSKIGEQQSRIGEKQGKLGEQMGQIGEEMGKLATASINREQDDEMSAKQEVLQKKMDALNAQMEVLNKQMEKPSREQEALGKKQEALGKQQEKASAIAEPKINKIIDNAFARGLAKPE